MGISTDGVLAEPVAMYCLVCMTRCSVNKAHLEHTSKLTQSLYMFHVYYQTCQILNKMSISLPDAETWNAYENAYNHELYSQTCREFNVPPNTDWRRKGFQTMASAKSTLTDTRQAMAGITQTMFLGGVGQEPTSHTIRPNNDSCGLHHIG